MLLQTWHDNVEGRKMTLARSELISQLQVVRWLWLTCINWLGCCCCCQHPAWFLRNVTRAPTELCGHSLSTTMTTGWRLFCIILLKHSHIWPIFTASASRSKVWWLLLFLTGFCLISVRMIWHSCHCKLLCLTCSYFILWISQWKQLYNAMCSKWFNIVPYFMQFLMCQQCWCLIYGFLYYYLAHQLQQRNLSANDAGVRSRLMGVGNRTFTTKSCYS